MAIKKSATMNILFCGTGGQGILTASQLCGWAAFFQGFHVKKSEVHGMAQRGGSVESHLRFGKKVFSALIPKGQADCLVPFEEGEYQRLKDFLKPQGRDLIEDLAKARQVLKDKRYLNTYMVGALARYLPIKKENWQHALELAFHDKDLQENKRVFYQAQGEER